MQETWVRSLGWEDLLEMATHSSILAWETPWTREPGGLQSMGWERVGHDWVTKEQKLYGIHPSVSTNRVLLGHSHAYSLLSPVAAFTPQTVVTDMRWAAQNEQTEISTVWPFTEKTGDPFNRVPRLDGVAHLRWLVTPSTGAFQAAQG